MKKIIVVLIVLLSLTGCSTRSELKTEPENKVSEVENKFTYLTGKVLKDNVLVQYGTLNRGDIVTYISEDSELAYIEKDNLVLGIDPDYIRSTDSEPFVEYDGYAKSGTVFYSDVKLKNKIKTLALNETVKVLDSFAGVLYVEVDGVYGYVKDGTISKTKIVYKATTAPATTSSDSNDSGSSSSSNDGQDIPSPSPSGDNSGDGQDVPTPGSGGSESGDGQDITLSFSYQNKDDVEYLEGTKEYVVLADDTPVYITRLNRGDVVDIVEKGDEVSTILFTGRTCTIESMYIRDDSEMYVTWDGYTVSGASIYKEYELITKIKACSLNSVVKIIDEVGTRYVVELDNGEIGYMLKTSVSENAIKIAPAKTTTTTSEDSGSSYSDGGSTDSGSSDNGSSGGGSSGGDSGSSDSGSPDDAFGPDVL